MKFGRSVITTTSVNRSHRLFKNHPFFSPASFSNYLLYLLFLDRTDIIVYNEFCIICHLYMCHIFLSFYNCQFPWYVRQRFQKNIHNTKKVVTPGSNKWPEMSAVIAHAAETSQARLRSSQPLGKYKFTNLLTFGFRAKKIMGTFCMNFDFLSRLYGLTFNSTHSLISIF